MTTHPVSTHRGLRLFALCAVTLGLLLLAAAAFVLSYAGVHAIALDSGVSPRLARLYPLILDAMVVVAGAAVLSLRGAGLPSRWYAWVSLLVLLAAGAGADTLHAIGTALPRKPAAAAAAIIPWALLLIGFGLLLAMLRHARLRADVRRQTRRMLVPAGRQAKLDDGTGVGEEAGLDEAIGLDEEADLDEEGGLDEEAGLDQQVELEDEAEPDGQAVFQPEDIEAAALSGSDPAFGSDLPGIAPQFERVHSTPLPPEG